MKTAAVLIRDDPRGGAFALSLRPHHGAFGSLSVLIPGNLPSKKKKKDLMPEVGGHGRSFQFSPPLN